MTDLFLQITGLPPFWSATLLGILGLLVGSFLNVVIHRLPIMMEWEWAEQAQSANATEPDANAKEAPVFNLMTPRSRCPHCGHAIAWYENLPLVSWLALRGRCRDCKAPISVRYPLVELATAVCFGLIGHALGASAAGLAWSAFAACLIALALIDWDTTLLPDSMTIPLVWAGLIAAQMGWTGIRLDTALWGAVAGYLSLWSIVMLFWLVTGKVGMGHGDFKLFAALGAWFGWPALVPIVLCASVAGAVIGLVIKIRGSLREGGVFPFGPFLVAGAALYAVAPGMIMGWFQ
jgi:leader peptidase (prepilin peptidase)/N-methyltransferase